ncbi:Uncharacterised protein [Bordetella pseudohinzii]|uniref:J domain-containing protein n=2 Tax=Bordetella pseudohinzii TaxID=1331258 RepID=A0A0M7DSA6_9BORD|nr:Uncharacterised protein [Bordetella pseudohinzii]
MQAINAAYAVLSCPDERARYDRTLSAAESHNKSSRQTYADGEPTRDFSSNSSEGEEYEQTPYKSDNPMGSGPMPVAPEPIRLLRSGEYAALIVFTLITVLIFAKGQAGQTRGQPPATPATAAALIPVPPAPPRRDNQPAPLSIPAAKNSAVSSIKVLKAPNGAPWPTTSGYLEGYDSSDYGGSIIDLVNTNTKSAFFVKLVNTARNAKHASRHLFLGSRQGFSIVNIAPGSYFLAYQDLMSGGYYRTDAFNLSQKPSPQDPTRLQFTTVRFEFSARSGGYLDSHAISAAEFHGAP